MNLLLIGCGNIGGILLEKWQDLKLLDRIVVVQPSMKRAADFTQNISIEFVRSVAAIPANFIEDITVLAIKPNMCATVLPLLADRPNGVVLSLLAAMKIAHIAAYLAPSTKIIRLMPNIAIKTGNSVTLAYTNFNVQAAKMDWVEKLLYPVGTINWLDDEKLIDLLTPITSSGPTYFLLMAQYLVDATVQLGITEELAEKLVHETLLSTATIVADNTNYPQLIESITSKKGVTEAALKTLRPGLQPLLTETITAALKRLNEIADENSR